MFKLDSISVDNPLSPRLATVPKTIVVTITETRYVTASTQALPPPSSLFTTQPPVSPANPDALQPSTRMHKSFVWPNPPLRAPPPQIGTFIPGLDTAVHPGIFAGPENQGLARRSEPTNSEAVTRRPGNTPTNKPSQRTSPRPKTTFSTRYILKPLPLADRAPHPYPSGLRTDLARDTFTPSTRPSTSAPTTGLTTTTDEPYPASRTNYGRYFASAHSPNAGFRRYTRPSFLVSAHGAMADFDLPPFPPTLQLVLYVCMGLGLLWVLIVWLVNFPPSTWRSARAAKDKNAERSKSEKQGGSWWRRVLRLDRSDNQSKKQKPVDKPNRYVMLPSTSSTTSSASASASSLPDSASTKVHDTAITSAKSAFPLRQRRPFPSPGKPQSDQGHELMPLESNAAPESPKMPPWQRNMPKLRRHASPDADEAMSPTSPLNPFLPSLSQPPPSNSEYLAAHNTFFKPSSQPHSPSSSPTRSGTSGIFSYEDVDALEAQTERTSHQQSSSEVHLSPNGAAAARSAKKRWSGANLLEAVDDAVSWGVEKVVKWTDETGDEGLLLPLANCEAERSSRGR